MAKILLAQFKVSVPKPKRKASDGISKISRITRGKVILDEGIYKVEVKNEDEKTTTIYEFTERSYDLTGRTDIFSKEKDEFGRTVRYIRDQLSAKLMPGSPEHYTPFATNWIISGNIVNDKGKIKFDFKNLIGKDGYMNVEHFDDD